MDLMGIQLAYFEMIQIDTYFSALKSAMGSMFFFFRVVETTKQ
jgi:hypothetical protein